MTHLDADTLKSLMAANIDGSFPILMTVYNPDIFWSDEEKKVYNQKDGYIHFISDNIKVNYKQDEEGKPITWLPCAFNFTPPDKDGKKISTASVSISALDLRVRELLSMIILPSKVTVEALFVKTKTEEDKTTFKFIELNSISFMMNSATCNKTIATFSLVPDLSLQQNIPYDTALPNRVPSGV